VRDSTGPSGRCRWWENSGVGLRRKGCFQFDDGPNSSILSLLGIINLAMLVIS